MIRNLSRVALAVAVAAFAGLAARAQDPRIEPPRTPAEFWNAVEFELDTGKFDVAAQYLKAFLAANPTEQDYLAIEKERGMAAFLRLRTVIQWSADKPTDDEARKNAELVIEKASAAIDEKTEGKYHDKVAKAKASFAVGLDRIEEARTSGPGSSAGSSGSGSADEWTVDEGAMHVGEEAPTAAPADSATAGPDSTVRPESAAEGDVTDRPDVRLTESAEEPRDQHDPQAWANETDRLS